MVAKLGGTIDSSEIIEGMVFDHKAIKSAGGPTRVENAKIALIQFQISPPKTDIENNVIISDYQQMDRILKEERNYILQIVKKIKATGCNVLLIQKSILRDAVTDLSLHYLVGSRMLAPCHVHDAAWFGLLVVERMHMHLVAAVLVPSVLGQLKAIGSIEEGRSMNRKP